MGHREKREAGSETSASTYNKKGRKIQKEHEAQKQNIGAERRKKVK